MLRSYIFQLKLMTAKRGFQYSFTLVMLVICIAFIDGLSPILLSNIDDTLFPLEDISAYPASDNYILNEMSQFLNVLKFIFPFIAPMPFAFSFITDKSLHISEIIQSRCGNKRYFMTKTAAVFTGGFLVLFLPLLVGITLNHIFGGNSIINLFHMNFSEMAVEHTFIVKNDFQLSLLTVSPVLGELFAAFCISFFCGVCSVTAFAFSLFIRKFAVLVFVPAFVFIKLCDAAYSAEISQKGYGYIMLEPLGYSVVSTDNMIYGRSYLLFFGLNALILAISLLVIYIHSKHDQIN